MLLDRLIRRAERYRQVRGISHTYLARLLFNDGKKGRLLQGHGGDIETRTYEEAVAKLETLEREIGIGPPPGGPADASEA